MIVLPWPPRDLSPNSRPHHMAKAKAAKIYRDAAYWLTVPARRLFDLEGEIMLRCEFYPPDKRRRDLDGMFASIKSGLDGIADSLQVNDYRFGFEIHRRAPVKGGKVVITIIGHGVPLRGSLT